MRENIIGTWGWVSYVDYPEAKKSSEVARKEVGKLRSTKS